MGRVKFEEIGSPSGSLQVEDGGRIWDDDRVGSMKKKRDHCKDGERMMVGGDDRIWDNTQQMKKWDLDDDWGRQIGDGSGRVDAGVVGSKMIC